MSSPPRDRLQRVGGAKPRRRTLFGKYVLLFLGVVACALLPMGALDLWFSYQAYERLLVRIQTEQARGAAQQIERFVAEIVSQMAWQVQVPLQTRSTDEWRLDAVRLFRQVPALTEIAQLDANGRERFRMSRQEMDVIGSLRDESSTDAFSRAVANKVYYGPVYFVHQSEPYMTLAVAGNRRDEGVLIGRINLKFIWDVVSRMEVGRKGQAYVIDDQGHLIAHRDISLVLRKVDLSSLPYVQQAREAASEVPSEFLSVVDFNGNVVLSAGMRIAPLNWSVFVELPEREAYAPVYAMLVRSSSLLLFGLFFATAAGVFLARKMVVPVRALRDGAARIEAGDLAQRINITTGDELQELGEQFNSMAERLEHSHLTLEGKVEERTQQLAAAIQAKSRFLAAASHDLRQPLHALGLFFAQLKGRLRSEDRKKILEGIDAALASMNDLFNALLDISRLEAGALTPTINDFPVKRVFNRLETNFGSVAREKGLRFSIVETRAWIRSDPLLLERVVGNLVSNAVRYTESGGVIVGCRHTEGMLQILVVDSGPGIPDNQREQAFTEFTRLRPHDRGGLGLGLAIVARLCRLLGHPISIRSVVGRGSSFAVQVPLGDPKLDLPAPQNVNGQPYSAGRRLVVVIDDDQLVLDSMAGLLEKWGYRAKCAMSSDEALTLLASALPDAIVCDYQLGEETGAEAVARLSSAIEHDVPAILMTGDTSTRIAEEVKSAGFPLLQKPISPASLRAALIHAMPHQPGTRKGQDPPKRIPSPVPTAL